jgi:hypothetical protein
MAQVRFKYRFKRCIINLRRRFRKIKNRIEKEEVVLNEIQKPLISICLKLITNPDTELRNNSIDFTFHIENENYLVILRSNSVSNSLHSITLIDYNKSIYSVIDVPVPETYVRLIVEKFDREVHRRMKNKEFFKNSKVSNHLNSILKNLE